MNAAMFYAMTPILVLSGTAMALMIQASIKRDHKLASIIVAIGLILSLLGSYYASSFTQPVTCLLYTSPSPRDATLSRMPSSA